MEQIEKANVPKLNRIEKILILKRSDSLFPPRLGSEDIILKIPSFWVKRKFSLVIKELKA